MTVDYPTINVEEKTNEQNMQITKSYLINLVDQLNYQITMLEGRLAQLEGNKNG